MPTSLTLDEHLALIEASGAALAEQAETAGLAAPVPTCPAWDVAKLVAHQAMVHRWAAGNLAGEPFERTQTQIHDEERDLLGYFRSGVEHLLATLRTVRDDVQALVFLKDAPAPRRFWARRQAHETTIHAVDALAAALRRFPTTDECVGALPIAREVAVDGIDELVCGFMPRGRSKLATGQPFVIVIHATDVDAGWTLRVGEERLVAEPRRPVGERATFAGTAAALYLGLWNRGEEVAADGDALVRWRQLQRVTWS